MKKTKWIVTACVIIVITVWIIYAQLQGIPVLTGTVTKGTIREFVEERAETSLPTPCNISMPQSGRIEPITLIPGTKVNKGQLIAMIEEADFQTAYTIASAKIQALEGQININKYNGLEKTALNESAKWISAMNNMVDVSNKKVAASGLIYKFADDYRKTLQNSGQAISRIENSKAEMEAAVKKVDLESANIMLNAFKIVDSIFKLAPVYINEFLNIKVLKLNVLQSQLDEAKAEQKMAKINLDRCRIKSPMDGIVLKKYYENQRYLSAGTLLMEIGNLDELEVTAGILSSDAVNIQPGDNVDISAFALNNIPITGKVIRIDPKGYTKLSSLGVEQQRVHVKIAFDKGCLTKLKQAKKTLGVGFRMQVKIYTALKHDVLKVPRSSLIKNNSGEWQVYVVDSSIARLKTVSIGLINDSEAEITKGLNEKDVIILAPGNNIEDGTRVQ